MKPRRLVAWLSTLLLLSSISLPAAAQGDVQEVEPLSPMPTLESSQLIDETQGSWFVELTGAPESDGATKASVKKNKDDFRAAASAAKVKYKERRSFDDLFNGFSVDASAAEASALAKLPGVKAVYPNITIERPQVDRSSADPDMYTATGMTGVDIVRNELGYTGKGIKVAIMDTGVDYHHPDLGGCFGPGCRVAYGYDLVGDDYNADSTSPAYNPVLTPDNDPDDCGGHGTHVAGIVGASGTVTGVAPDVIFGAYRVFGCEGSTTADVMVEAMELAKKDGMQVLNMSIGSSFQWAQYPTAQAASRLVKKGMVVVASIGNSGANGLYASGAPGVGENVIGVASIENSHIFLRQFTISPDGQAVGYVNATAAPTAPLSGSFELARTGTQTTANDGCVALPAGSLTGKVALIRRGTCGFYDKALNAQNAGAAGVVLYNNAPGAVNPTVAGAVQITVPVVMASQTQGNLIDSRLASGPVTMTWTDTQGSYPNSLGGTIASSSSYGLAPDLSLKPDISAPGANIYSTYPLEAGGYATLSGTSMASPHVAGASALLLEAQRKTKAEDVRSILQNSALPKAWWGNPALGFLDQVQRQGAGLLQIDRAIMATSAVTPSKLSLGESEAGPAVRKLTIENNSSADVTYDVTHVPALSTGPNAYTVGAQTGFATVDFSSSTVTVHAKKRGEVQVTITANDGLAERSIYGGYIVFTPQGGGEAVRVPYVGMKGDYQSMPILTSGGAFGFPWLASRSGTSYSRLGEGTSFTMANGDIPYFVAHFDHMARRLLVEVKEAATGTSWHLAANEEYLAKNSTPTGIFAFAFDGTTTDGKKKTYTVPNGDYVLEVKALKPLGDEQNPAHWETWTSPMFTINRP